VAIKNASDVSSIRQIGLLVLGVTALIRFGTSVAQSVNEPRFEFHPPAPAYAAPDYTAPSRTWSVSEGPLVFIDDVPMDYVAAATLLLQDPVTAKTIRPVDLNYTNAQVDELLAFGAHKGLVVVVPSLVASQPLVQPEPSLGESVRPRPSAQTEPWITPLE
jgi:hypothetical protein